MQSPSRDLVDVRSIDGLFDSLDLVQASPGKASRRVSFVVFQLGDRFEQLQSMSAVGQDSLAFPQNPEVVYQTFWLSHSTLIHNFQSVGAVKVCRRFQKISVLEVMIEDSQ